uniref:Uncharacterized protein n=1 Tax=Anguilla anguilla TaxID=7936 RepID=A0A0E9R042_ANGAN
MDNFFNLKVVYAQQTHMKCS